MRASKKELLATMFYTIVVLILAGFIFQRTKLEFDPHNARFRVSDQALGITYRSSIRETWLTQFTTNNDPQWKTVIIRGGRPSVWHGVAGGVAVQLRTIGNLDDTSFFSVRVRDEIAQHILQLVNQSNDTSLDLSEAQNYLDCIMNEFQDQYEVDDEISDELVREILLQCSTDLDD